MKTLVEVELVPVHDMK